MGTIHLINLKTYNIIFKFYNDIVEYIIVAYSIPYCPFNVNGHKARYRELSAFCNSERVLLVSSSCCATNG